MLGAEIKDRGSFHSFHFLLIHTKNKLHFLAGAFLTICGLVQIPLVCYYNRICIEPELSNSILAPGTLSLEAAVWVKG